MTVDSETTLFTCANCEAEFRWLPLVHHGLAFCCAGCAVGGPCSCSYDDHARQSHSDGRGLEEVRVLPMTAEVWRHLSAEATRLALEIEDARARQHRDIGEPAVIVTGGIPAWEIERAEARLATLRDDLERAEVVEPGPAAIVGSRVTVRRLDDGLETFALVPPGDQDPTVGHVSPDSPLGQALLYARPGDLVSVQEAGGTERWRVEEVRFPGQAQSVTAEAVA